MSMAFLLHYNPMKTRELFTEATPKVTRGSFGRETRTEGFTTESCEAVAKRLMDSVDRQPRKYIEAFADLIRVKLLKDPAAKDKAIDILMYEAFAEAFKNEFEKATYNGSKTKHAGKDLFTRPRAEAKAQRMALEITCRLLKDKRAGLRTSIFHEVSTLLSSHTFTDMSFDKKRLERDVKPTIDETRSAVLIEADSLLEEIDPSSIIGYVADKTASVGIQTFERNKWQSRLAICSAMQVPFSDTLQLGSSKSRAGKAAPKAWENYQKKALEVADHMCLRALTQQTIEPFFRVARMFKGTTFDMLLTILANLSAKDPEAARVYYHETLSADQRLELHQLVTELTEATSEMPALPLDVGKLSEKMESLGSGLSEKAKTELSMEVAPMLYLASLSGVKETLSLQLAKVEGFFASFRTTTRPTTEGNQRGLTHEPLTAAAAPKTAQVKQDPSLILELSSRLRARNAQISNSAESASSTEIEEEGDPTVV